MKNQSKNQGYRIKLIENARLVKKGLSDWKISLGLFINGFTLFSFFVDLFQFGPLNKLKAFLDFYDNLKSKIFGPFEWLFSIDIPGLLQDSILFWVLSGAIAARTLFWLHEEYDQAIEAVLLKVKDPDTRRHLEETKGTAYVEQETQWAAETQKFHEVTLDRKIVLYLGCLITGPLFFFRIWMVSPPVPGLTITGRNMIVIEVLTLLSIVGLLFTLD